MILFLNKDKREDSVLKQGSQSIHKGYLFLKKYDPNVRKVTIISVIFQFLNSIEYLFACAIYLKFLLYCIRENKSLDYIVTSFILISVLMLIIKLYSGWYELYGHPVLINRIRRTFSKQIYERTYTMNLRDVQDPEHYEDYRKVMDTAKKYIVEYLDNISNLFGQFLMCVFVSSVIWTIDKKALIILVLPISTTWILGKRHARESYEANKERQAGEVRKDYVKRCFYGKNYTYEMRMTNVSKPLKKLFYEGVAIKNKVNEERGRRCFKISFLFELLKNRIPFSLILIYAVYQVMVSKTMKPEDISIMLIGLVNLSDKISDLVGTYAKLDESKKYIYDIDYYLKKFDVEPKTYVISKKEDVSFSSDITFQNVTFRYGNSEKNQINHLNLTIKKGEKIAIVGKNGAGKTTLINLLLRLYQPDEGKILLDGIPIEQIDSEVYRGAISVVEQDARLFSVSIKDNITCGKAGNGDEKAALQFSDMWDKVNALPDGVDTYYTKEFGEGVNLSKGEQQKIAISRAFASQGSIYVFDEPTSALDPLSEEDMLQKMLLLSADKTAIFIMHRMSFAKDVDRILFMENGSILEQGSHDELMKCNGKYAEMFNLQAKNYQTEVQR